MRVGIDSLLSSILAFSTDLLVKEFKLHTDYSWITEQIKPLQPVGQTAEFKVESKFKPLPVIWSDYSRRQSKVLTAKSMAQLLGRRSCTALACLTGDHLTERFRVGGSRCGPQQARLRGKSTTSLPLLQYVISSVKKGFYELARTCYRPKPRSLIRSIFL